MCYELKIYVMNLTSNALMKHETFEKKVVLHQASKSASHPMRWSC